MSMDYDANEVIAEFGRKRTQLKIMHITLILLTGISGTWWYWYYGILALIKYSYYNLIIYGILSMAIFIVLSMIIANHSDSRLTFIVRIIAMIGIIQLYYMNGDTMVSILLFIVLVMFHDDLAFITARIMRTQTYANTTKHDLNFIHIIRSANIYIDDRIYWLFITKGMIFAIGLIAIIIIRLINNISSKIPVLMQLFSFLAIISIGIFILPKMYSIRKKEVDLYGV